MLFWPGMSAQITETVSICETCTKHQKHNTREPLLPHKTPGRPWETVCSDLCELHGRTYLILVDYYSGFIEIEHVKETSSNNIISRLKAQFARYGIPDTLVTDNGPQYSSHSFKEFATKFQFTHATSSPHYPQSNGKAERAVQTVKSILKKAYKDKQDPYLALLALRNTPLDNESGSPAQRLMGRRTKTLLPTSIKLLQPRIIKPSLVKETINLQKQRQKQYYDRSSKKLSPLHPGNTVIIQDRGSSIFGKITGVADAPRSYIVTTANGVYRRNRRHLKLTKHQNTEDESDSYSYHNSQSLPTTENKDHQGSHETQTDQENPVEDPVRRSTRIKRRPDWYVETHTQGT